MSRWEHFIEDELTCKCGCGQMLMQDSFMAKVVAIRKILGQPMIVTSAYRCPEYNAKVSSTGLTGPHTTGRAIDISCGSRDRYWILELAKKQGMSRFGIAKWGIHLDDLTKADGFDEHVIWPY